MRPQTTACDVLRLGSTSATRVCQGLLSWEQKKTSHPPLRNVRQTISSSLSALLRASTPFFPFSFPLHPFLRLFQLHTYP
jgi:hypothetical protein